MFHSQQVVVPIKTAAVVLIFAPFNFLFLCGSQNKADAKNKGYTVFSSPKNDNMYVMWLNIQIHKIQLVIKVGHVNYQQ